MFKKPLEALQPFLSQDKQLCLLPVSHEDPVLPVAVSETAILFPKQWLKPSDIRLVSSPADEAAEITRRLGAIGLAGLRAHKGARAWLASARTEISSREFFARALLACPVETDWDAFLEPESCLTHLQIMDEAIQGGKAHLDGLDPDQRRLYLPRVKHARFGYIPSSTCNALLFYTPHEHESYIVGGRLEDWYTNKAHMQV
ncbi:hypothetical protein MCRY_16460 [Marivita cryptomonadis]|uniref:hypothetical protein n=1 Tax=Marivita cryptomonadis TaxID=505252 RepID=UPI000A227F95|nr:hypothetical protein [Marivita cryptomonadis]OSQ57807.1 hypothetical protein MCRY_16460 [Marivita cryptomonadis]